MIKADEFMEYITNYYSIKERRPLKFYYQFDINDDGVTKTPNISIFHSCFIMGEKITVKLHEEDILEPLTVYAKAEGYELISYKYVGGIHNVGYFTDNEIPVFEGVMLTAKKLNKTKTRKK